MNRNRTLSGRWKWGLLVLLALMVSWGHQNAKQAVADATAEIEFSIAVGGCDTANANEANKCTLAPGSSFTLDMSWDGFSGAHADDATAVQMRIHWTGAVSGPNVANGKSLTSLAPTGCDLPVALLEPGGDTTRALIGCVVVFAPTVSTGLIGTAQFNCDGVGQGTIELEHGNGDIDTLALDPTLLPPHWEDNTTDTLTINCAAPPTPTATPTPTPLDEAPTPIGGIGVFPGVAGTPLEAPPSSGSNAGVLAGVIVAAVTAGAVTLGGAAWYV